MDDGCWNCRKYERESRCVIAGDMAKQVDELSNGKTKLLYDDCFGDVVVGLIVEAGFKCELFTRN